MMLCHLFLAIRITAIFDLLRGGRLLISFSVFRF